MAEIGNGPIIGDVIPPTPQDTNLLYQDEPDDGIDLVEQLYGTDLSMRQVEVNILDSIVLPAAPKNKILEIAAWERSATTPGTPRTGRFVPSPSSSIPNTPFHPSQTALSDETSASGLPATFASPKTPAVPEPLSLEDYSNRMEAAAIMLAQLNANLVREPITGAFGSQPSSDMTSTALSWLPGSGWIMGTPALTPDAGISSVTSAPTTPASRMRLQPAEAAAIRERIMQEMLALEEERMERMKASSDPWASQRETRGKTKEDEGIVRRELNKVSMWISTLPNLFNHLFKVDPSAIVFQESWASKKARIRSGSPYGHLATWDVRNVPNAPASTEIHRASV